MRVRECENCGCVDFIVRFRQVEEYDACIDVNLNDILYDGNECEVISVNTIEGKGYVCKNCGKHYDSLDDIPEIDDDSWGLEEGDINETL